MAFSVEKHQNFAKQCTIISLLIFATLAIQLKLPKEGDKENSIIGGVKVLRSLDGFTYFELNFIIKQIVYPSIFSMALNVSRMVDMDPASVIKNNLEMTQKKISKTLVLGELICNLDKLREEER